MMAIRLVLFCALLGSLMLPVQPVEAQTAGREVAIILVDVRTPGGYRLNGMFNVLRSLDGSGRVDWQFQGVYNNTRLSASGVAYERWNRRQVQVELTELLSDQVRLDQLPLREFPVIPRSPGVVTVAGFPVAVSTPIRPPGAGILFMVVTNVAASPAANLSRPDADGGILRVFQPWLAAAGKLLGLTIP